MKNSIYKLSVIFVLFAVSYNFANAVVLADRFTVNSTEFTSSFSPNTLTMQDEQNCIGLTLANYKKIKKGMTYRKVVSIIGCEGKETMSSGNGKYKVNSYQWKADDFKFLSIVLMGDKVTSKTQANLE